MLTRRTVFIAEGTLEALEDVERPRAGETEGVDLITLALTRMAPRTFVRAIVSEMITQANRAEGVNSLIWHDLFMGPCVRYMDFMEVLGIRDVFAWVNGTALGRSALYWRAQTNRFGKPPYMTTIEEMDRLVGLARPPRDAMRDTEKMAAWEQALAQAQSALNIDVISLRERFPGGLAAKMRFMEEAPGGLANYFTAINTRLELQDARSAALAYQPPPETPIAAHVPVQAATDPRVPLPSTPPLPSAPPVAAPALPTNFAALIPGGAK